MMTRTAAIAVCLVLVLALTAVECKQKVVELRMQRFNYRQWLQRNVYGPAQTSGDAGPPVKVPLLGNETVLGEYYIRFQLGTQSFSTQVDTGSSDLAIPGSSCKGCPVHIDPPYDPKASSTSAPVSCSKPPPPIQCNASLCDGSQCAYTIEYADHSGFGAAVYTDQLIMPGFEAVTQAFGAMTKEVKPRGGGNFEPFVTDGIMGFAYEGLSEINAPTPFDNLVASGQSADIFSMCMTDDGGTLTLGGIGPYAVGPIQYTPLVTTAPQPLYVVNMTEVSYNGQRIKVSNTILNGGLGAVVDSGTTELVFPYGVISGIKSIALSMCDDTALVGTCNVSRFQTIFDGFCFPMTQEQLDLYPPINITLGSDPRTAFVVSVAPKYYFTQGICNDETAYGMAMAGWSAEGTIMGDTFMKNYEVVFDRANKRVGFGAIGTCPDGKEDK